MFMNAARPSIFRAFAASNATQQASKDTKTVEPKKVILFPGHGIGPEITNSVLKIFDLLKSKSLFSSSNILGRTPDPG